jgi:hypothetical protein
MTLSSQDEQFCRAYAADGDGPAAYRLAHPRVKSDRAARAGAARMLARPEVVERIDELRRRQPAAADVTLAWVLARLKQEAEGTESDPARADRVTALGLLLKHLGTTSAAGPESDAPPYDLSKLSDEQKLALLAAVRLLRSGRAPGAEPALALPPAPGAGGSA